MKKALIIGGGFRLCNVSSLNLIGGWDVKIVESSSFLGAGVRTFITVDILILLVLDILSPYKDVYDYLNNIIPLELHPNAYSYLCRAR